MSTPTHTPEPWSDGLLAENVRLRSERDELLAVLRQVVDCDETPVAGDRALGRSQRLKLLADEARATIAALAEMVAEQLDAIHRYEQITVKNSIELEVVKRKAASYMKGRNLKPESAKGYEALLAFYAATYDCELPPFVTICFACGRQKELIA